jgi:hypothetical protein
MASKEDSTGGATRSKGEAVRAVTGVGGVRSSEEAVPDLWSGQPTEERRDATCSAESKSNEGRGAAHKGHEHPIKVQKLRITLYRKAADKWNSESRMRENRPSGLMRGGKQTVIGPRASQSVASRLLYKGDARRPFEFSRVPSASCDRRSRELEDT